MQASSVLVATRSIFGFQKASDIFTFEKLTGVMGLVSVCAVDVSIPRKQDKHKSRDVVLRDMIFRF
jgi:hypothetical protein